MATAKAAVGLEQTMKSALLSQRNTDPDKFKTAPEYSCTTTITTTNCHRHTTAKQTIPGSSPSHLMCDAHIMPAEPKSQG